MTAGFCYSRITTKLEKITPRRSETAPSSPTEGYSHIWLEDLGLAASDVDSVKFYCKTSAHSRVMHFSSSTDWVKNAIVTGSDTGQSSFVLDFRDDEICMITPRNLPDAADLAAYNELTNAIFYVSNTYHWGMKIQGSRWECDDMSFNTHTTLSTRFGSNALKIRMNRI